MVEGQGYTKCVHVKGLILLPIVLCASASIASGESQLNDVTVHSPGLEHNLLGDSADQRIFIYLPDAYSK